MQKTTSSGHIQSFESFLYLLHSSIYKSKRPNILNFSFEFEFISNMISSVTYNVAQVFCNDYWFCSNSIGIVIIFDYKFFSIRVIVWKQIFWKILFNRFCIK